MHTLDCRACSSELVRKLKEITDTDERTMTATEARSYLKLNESQWIRYKELNLVVPFYRPHTSRPIYKKSQLDTLLSFRPWGEDAHK